MIDNILKKKLLTWKKIIKRWSPSQKPKDSMEIAKCCDIMGSRFASSLPHMYTQRFEAV